jgi:hypothetical protein
MSSGQTIGQASYARAISGKLPNIVFTGASYTKKKEKKMGWLKRKFAKWSREAWENVHETKALVERNSPDAKTSMRFTIYPASGGYVIEHYKQDRYKDNEGPSLTIVNNGDSLGTAVEHILAIEALKA